MEKQCERRIDVVRRRFFRTTIRSRESNSYPGFALRRLPIGPSRSLRRNDRRRTDHDVKNLDHRAAFSPATAAGRNAAPRNSAAGDSVGVVDPQSCCGGDVPTPESRQKSSAIRHVRDNPDLPARTKQSELNSPTQYGRTSNRPDEARPISMQLQACRISPEPLLTDLLSVAQVPAEEASRQPTCDTSQGASQAKTSVSKQSTGTYRPTYGFAETRHLGSSGRHGQRLRCGHLRQSRNRIHIGTPRWATANYPNLSRRRSRVKASFDGKIPFIPSHIRP